MAGEEDAAALRSAAAWDFKQLSESFCRLVDRCGVSKPTRDALVHVSCEIALLAASLEEEAETPEALLAHVAWLRRAHAAVRSCRRRAPRPWHEARALAGVLLSPSLPPSALKEARRAAAALRARDVVGALRRGDAGEGSCESDEATP